MVDSDRGITSLHVPPTDHRCLDAPADPRSGQMWNRDGDQQDTLFVIPDHLYAALYAETVEDCRRNGAFDPRTMGTTPNVGLMAQKARSTARMTRRFDLISEDLRVVTQAARRCSHESRRRIGARVRPSTRGRRLGRAGGPPRAGDRSTGRFWLDETRPTMRSCCPMSTRSWRRRHGVDDSSLPSRGARFSFARTFR